MNRFEEIRDLVLSLESDFEAAYEKSNKAAGVRVRKGMQDLKTMAQEIRVDIQTRKQS